jgi:hypothetical protein
MKESVEIIKLKPNLSDNQVDKLKGTLLSEKDYNTLVTYNADVYCEETGQCVAKFRKKVIPSNIASNAYNALKSVAISSSNRGISGGSMNDKGTFSEQRIKKDGTKSNTALVDAVASGIIGYFDRNPRTPYCRQTAFNEKQFNKFKKAYPIIKFVDRAYAQLMPEQYKLQRDEADKTAQDFVINDTAFTTVTVNKNWQTAVHTDAGDFEKGFGNLVALRKGRYVGGYFVVPKWGVAFDLQNSDLLLVDVHQWHGNTPIKILDEDAKRISLVMYYRKNMIHCGTSEQETDRAKHRKEGDKLNG